MSLIRQCSTAFFNFFVPPFCSVCRILLANRAILCVACAKHISPIVSYSLTLNKRYVLTVYALSDYQMPLKKLIVAKRYGNSVASRQLGRLMALKTPMQFQKYDAIIPIPLHWFRYIQRGYNQSEEIAYELSKKHGLPVFQALKRRRNTIHQTGMSKKERSVNVKNAFELLKRDMAYLAGKRLLLIDDVMTTGETIRAVAKELVKCKPASIDVFVACRVV